MSQKKTDTFGKKVLELGNSGKSFINDPEIQRKLSKAKSDTETIIRKHPMASLGVGLLVGFFIGKLLSRD